MSSFVNAYKKRENLPIREIQTSMYAMQCNAMEICGNHIHGSLKTVDFLILCKVKKKLSKNNLIKGKKEEKFNYTF